MVTQGKNFQSSFRRTALFIAFSSSGLLFLSRGQLSKNWPLPSVSSTCWLASFDLDEESDSGDWSREGAILKI